MSYGPCKQYRPWKGQEPLCGNCAWTEEGHKLQPHQERVIAEKKELDEKLAKLKEFVFGNGNVFAMLPPRERDLLEDQYTAMRQYSKILGKRIDAF